MSLKTIIIGGFFLRQKYFFQLFTARKSFSKEKDIIFALSMIDWNKCLCDFS